MQMSGVWCVCVLGIADKVNHDYSHDVCCALSGHSAKRINVRAECSEPNGQPRLSLPLPRALPPSTVRRYFHTNTLESESAPRLFCSSSPSNHTTPHLSVSHCQSIREWRL